MRCVKILERPNEIYPFAVDQTTGEVPLQLADRTALVALCGRLGWAIQDDSQPADISRGADLFQRIERRRDSRLAKPAKHRLGGATKYTSARKRRASRAAASSVGTR
jgi:hypothetical protein